MWSSVVVLIKSSDFSDKRAAGLIILEGFSLSKFPRREARSKRPYDCRPANTGHLLSLVTLELPKFENRPRYHQPSPKPLL